MNPRAQTPRGETQEAQHRAIHARRCDAARFPSSPAVRSGSGLPAEGRLSVATDDDASEDATGGDPVRRRTLPYYNDERPKRKALSRADEPLVVSTAAATTTTTPITPRTQQVPPPSAPSRPGHPAVLLPRPYTRPAAPTPRLSAHTHSVRSLLERIVADQSGDVVMVEGTGLGSGSRGVGMGMGDMSRGMDSRGEGVGAAHADGVEGRGEG